MGVILHLKSLLGQMPCEGESQVWHHTGRGTRTGLIPTSSGRDPSSKLGKPRKCPQGTHSEEGHLLSLLKSKKLQSLKRIPPGEGQLKPYWAPTASTQVRVLLCLLLAPNPSFHLGEVWCEAQKSSRGAPCQSKPPGLSKLNWSQEKNGMSKLRVLTNISLRPQRIPN